MALRAKCDQLAVIGALCVGLVAAFFLIMMIRRKNRYSFLGGPAKEHFLPNDTYDEEYFSNDVSPTYCETFAERAV